MSERIKSRLRRISDKFAIKGLDEIKIQRIKEGIDRDKISDVRLTEAMVKEPEFQRLKDKLIKMPRKEELR